MFKVWDKVVCVNAADSGDSLVSGKTYTIGDVQEEYVVLEEDENGYAWMASRFQLALDIDPLVEIRQSEYSALVEEINLLQELLSETNQKLAGLELQEFKPIAEMAYVDWQDIWDEDNPPRFLTSTGEIWTAEYLFKDAEYGYTVAFHQDDSTYSPDGDRLMTDGVDVKIIKRIK